MEGLITCFHAIIVIFLMAINYSPVFANSLTSIHAYTAGPSSRQCADCNVLPGLYFNPGYIVKGLIAVGLGTLLFFSLIFAYKLISFKPLPFKLSEYYGGSNGPGKGKPKLRSNSEDSANIVQIVEQAIHKYFDSK